MNPNANRCHDLLGFAPLTPTNCGADGGEFGCSYASCGAVANVIPVDGVIRGCPPTPLRLMQGILAAITQTGASTTP